MSSLTFGRGHSAFAYPASTPSLTQSSSSDHSEAIETDAFEAGHGLAPDQMWPRDCANTKTSLPLIGHHIQAPHTGELRRCGMTVLSNPWPWAMPIQDPNDCWTLRSLPWGQSAPSKTKWLSSACGHITTPHGTKFSCLTDDRGRRFVMGSCVSKGSSGKLKLCLPVDSPDEALCVKELRLPAPFAAPQVAVKKTIETSLRTMSFECAMSRQFGGPMAVQHAYAHGIRGYAFFPLARGCLFDFARDVPHYYRAPLARAVGKSVGHTLRNMHLLGRLHLDVKEGNILVHDQPPYVSLTDFGSAVPIDGPRASAHYGLQSTYCAPEALMENGFVARSSDMWSFGITLLTLLAPPQNYALFSYASTPGGSFDTEQSRAILANLEQGLRHFARGPKFTFDGNRFVPSASEALTADEEALQAWLIECHDVDPPFMRLVTDSLLVPHYARSSAAEFLRQLSWLEALPHRADLDAAVLAYLAASALDLRRGAAYDALNQIRISAFVSEHPEHWSRPQTHEHRELFDVCTSL